MEDQFSKYLRLFGTIFFSAIGFILILALVLIGLRYVLVVLDYIPWFRYVYFTLMLLIPAGLFLSIFSIFFSRTKTHPSKIIRLSSLIFFVLIMATWIIVLVFDCITFFKNGYPDIDKYNSYNLLYLVFNVFSIFFIGVVQALALPNEKDWMDKYTDK